MLTDIKERISRCSSHLSVPEAPKAIHECINQLKDLLLDCVVCHQAAFGSCPKCLEVQRTIGWALELIRKSEAK